MLVFFYFNSYSLVLACYLIPGGVLLMMFMDAPLPPPCTTVVMTGVFIVVVVVVVFIMPNVQTPHQSLQICRAQTKQPSDSCGCSVHLLYGNNL